MFPATSVPESNSNQFTRGTAHPRPGRWLPRLAAGVFALAASTAMAAPAPQAFLQEVAGRHSSFPNLPRQAVQLIDLPTDGTVRTCADGTWTEIRPEGARALPALTARTAGEFVVTDSGDRAVTLPVPWAEVRQVLRRGSDVWVVHARGVQRVSDQAARDLGRPGEDRVHQAAAEPDGTLWIATSGGLYARRDDRWVRQTVSDGRGRFWAAADVLAVTVDAAGRLWFGTSAGVGCRTTGGWVFYEGKDGLPWNEFTGAAAGPDGSVWFSTRLGVVRYDDQGWHYRQGPRWLPDDDAQQVVVDPRGRAWFATRNGLGLIERKRMTLAEKAEFYEQEIERHIKRTRFGYTAEAPLRTKEDKSTASPNDSDNDGLWTAMYGAGECFAYAATRDPKALARARQAFEALRFLQKVTQGGPHAPPHGYIARTIRPMDWPDPNIGRIARDREEAKGDSLWKVYEPRWPKSADGHWYWKSDTSSDELDGHYFFYPLYYQLCADTDAEKERVREVVRDITDHLIAHDFCLVDHDGKPTRWGVFGPKYLNRDPQWWPERGLNSLSMLSYLATAAFVTGDAKYETASRKLIDEHGYAHNAMYPKVQHGPGTGNQSDDEMAFMGYYNLLRYSRDEALKTQIRYSYFRYWVNEAPEMNPLFNFAYAAYALETSASSPWGTFRIAPWEGWLEDAMNSLRGFPLDRLNWSHRNSHRLDLVPLARHGRVDISQPGRRVRGHRVDGKVLPVENRFFHHWNTDPWTLDYPGGEGNELASGTVYLLPYYMGLYHGLIEKP